MSDPAKETANVGVGRGGGADEDDDEKGCIGVVPRDDRKKHRRNLRKAKQAVLFPFRKAKKKLYARNNNKRSSSSSDPPAAVVAPTSAADVSPSPSGKRVGCCLCFTQPQTLESSVKSQISDPNSPQFTIECLKALIEKNDFYSKECNPHIDSFSSFSD